MRMITPTEDSAPDDAGVTLSLTPEQLKALGLRKLPAAGDTVQLRATATVTDADDTHDAADADHDAAADAAGGDDDGDEAGQATGAAQHGADRQGTGITLHLTGLHLTQLHRAPDKVLYGSGD